MSDVLYQVGWIRELLDDGELQELDQHAGLVDAHASRLLSDMSRHFDVDYAEELCADDADVPDGAEDTEAFDDILSAEASAALSESVQSNPEMAVSHVTGTEDDGVDWSSLTASQQLRQLIDMPPHFACNVFGQRDAGKTTLATSIAFEWRTLRDGVIVSNYAGDWVDRQVTSWSEFRDLCLGDEQYFQSSFESGTEPEIPRSEPVLFLLEEASTWLDWRKHGDDVSQLYIPWLNRFAKYGVDVIHPAHSVMSVSKELRRPRVIPVQIDKTGLDTARVYSKLNPDTGTPIEDSELIPPIENIPDSPLDVDPDLPAPWTWS
jgi:hypothetical protein